MPPPIRLARFTLAVAAAAALAGCTNDSPVTARMAGANVEFVGPSDSKQATCLGSLRVVDARGTTMWEIAAHGPQGESRLCAARLPVAYGVVPQGFQATTPAKPLVPGTYALIGFGERVLRGTFRYAGPGQSVENFDPGSAPWCAAQYPGTEPGWLNQCARK